jgi:hypothetical protein
MVAEIQRTYWAILLYDLLEYIDGEGFRGLAMAYNQSAEPDHGGHCSPRP